MICRNKIRLKDKLRSIYDLIYTTQLKQTDRERLYIVSTVLASVSLNFSKYKYLHVFLKTKCNLAFIIIVRGIYEIVVTWGFTPHCIY